MCCCQWCYGFTNNVGIPLTTLRDHVDGRVHSDTLHAGAAPLLNQEQESNVVEHVKTMSEICYGYTREEVLYLASDYAVKLGLRDKENEMVV